jgi:hypothetical protein
MSAGRACLVASVLSLAAVRFAAATDWPQLQNGPGHTGYTTDSPRPPFSLKWTRDLREPTHPGAPVIIADGKVFVGTCWGNLRALDRRTGQDVWTYKTNGPIVGSAAYRDGLVYVNSMDRHCHAVRSADGAPVWQFETGEGIWAAPVVAGGRVFVAARDGFVYALDATSGRRIWQVEIGTPCLATPALDGGVLFVGGGDNRVYALEAADGRQRWRSDPLPGAAIRDYWLVAGRDSVIASTQLVFGAHHTFQQLEREVMQPFLRANVGATLVQDELIEQIRDWYARHPKLQSLFVLDAKTGRQRFIAPVVPVHGGGCAGPLPVIAEDGSAYVMYANVRLRASGWAFLGRLDLQSGKLESVIKDRWIIGREHHPEIKGDAFQQSAFGVPFCVNDQSWGLSLAGRRVLVVRDPGWFAREGSYSIVDLETGDDRFLGLSHDELREANGGSYAGAIHATASPMVVSDKQVFHKNVHNGVSCFEGR